MSCDPQTLLDQARPFVSLTEEQLALIIVSSYFQIAESGGGMAPGDFRITQSGDIRITQSGDFRVVD